MMSTEVAHILKNQTGADLRCTTVASHPCGSVTVEFDPVLRVYLGHPFEWKTRPVRVKGVR